MFVIIIKFHEFNRLLYDYIKIIYRNDLHTSEFDVKLETKYDSFANKSLLSKEVIKQIDRDNYNRYYTLEALCKSDLFKKNIKRLYQKYNIDNGK